MAPHVAAMLIDTLGRVEDFRYRYSARPPLAVALPADVSAWPTVAAAVDASCDMEYTGAGLTDSPALAREAAHVVVAYGKSDLPEFPSVVYHVDTGVWEYAYTARPVVFADGHAVLVPSNDLAAVLAEDRVARDRINSEHPMSTPPM
jgi:hypothetical protein